MTTPPKKPVDTLRDGSIKATIWGNPTDKGTIYSVTLSRTYRDGDAFKDSSSFGAIELLKVSRLAGKAYDRIAELRAESKEVDNGTEH